MKLHIGLYKTEELFRLPNEGIEIDYDKQLPDFELYKIALRRVVAHEFPDDKLIIHESTSPKDEILGYAVDVIEMGKSDEDRRIEIRLEEIDNAVYQYMTYCNPNTPEFIRDIIDITVANNFQNKEIRQTFCELGERIAKAMNWKITDCHCHDNEKELFPVCLYNKQILKFISDTVYEAIG